MEKLVQTIESVNSAVNSFAWGPVMLVLLVGTGVFRDQIRRFLGDSNDQVSAIGICK